MVLVLVDRMDLNLSSFSSTNISTPLPLEVIPRNGSPSAVFGAVREGVGGGRMPGDYHAPTVPPPGLQNSINPDQGEQSVWETVNANAVYVDDNLQKQFGPDEKPSAKKGRLILRGAVEIGLQLGFRRCLCFRHPLRLRLQMLGGDCDGDNVHICGVDWSQGAGGFDRLERVFLSLHFSLCVVSMYCANAECVPTEAAEIYDWVGN